MTEITITLTIYVMSADWMCSLKVRISAWFNLINMEIEQEEEFLATTWFIFFLKLDYIQEETECLLFKMQLKSLRWLVPVILREWLKILFVQTWEDSKEVGLWESLHNNQTLCKTWYSWLRISGIKDRIEQVGDLNHMKLIMSSLIMAFKNF